MHRYLLAALLSVPLLAKTPDFRLTDGRLTVTTDRYRATFALGCPVGLDNLLTGETVAAGASASTAKSFTNTAGSAAPSPSNTSPT